jgi:hypothetical protein
MRTDFGFLFLALFLVACPSDPSPTDAGHGAGGACTEITEACHDLDTGVGPIAECHDLGHDGPIAVCETRLTECVALCNAARGDGGAPRDGGPHVDASAEHHDDGGHGHDDDGGTEHEDDGGHGHGDDSGAPHDHDGGDH